MNSIKYSSCKGCSGRQFASVAIKMKHYKSRSERNHRITKVSLWSNVTGAGEVDWRLPQSILAAVYVAVIKKLPYFISSVAFDADRWTVTRLRDRRHGSRFRIGNDAGFNALEGCKVDCRRKSALSSQTCFVIAKMHNQRKNVIAPIEAESNLKSWSQE